MVIPQRPQCHFNFVAVGGQDILESLTQIPMETWNYKRQDPSIRHIGHMAKDFYTAFGVALEAIQGLYELVQEQNN